MLNHSIYIVLFILFLWINFLIVLSDIKKKIIPNFYLILLSIITFSFLILEWGTSDYVRFLLILAFYFFTSFILSSFNIWWAGDSKYFMVLGTTLYYLNLWIFIGNIVLITLWIIMYYFIHAFLKKNDDISITYLIKNDIKRYYYNLSDKYHHSKIEWLLYFLNPINFLILFFFLFRILRQVFIHFQNNFSEFQLDDTIIFLWIIIVLWLLQRSILFLKIKIKNKSHLKWFEIDTYFNLWMLFLLLPIIYFDYKQSPKVFLIEMYQIITISLSIYIIIRFFIYLYKKCFIDMEKSIINIDELQDHDIVDINFLKWRILPLKNQEDIPWRWDIEGIKKIVKKYYPHEPYISIMKTFPFAIVLFFAFLCSLIFESSPIFSIIDIIIEHVFHL